MNPYTRSYWHAPATIGDTYRLIASMQPSFFNPLAPLHMPSPYRYPDERPYVPASVDARYGYVQPAHHYPPPAQYAPPLPPRSFTYQPHGSYPDQQPQYQSHVQQQPQPHYPSQSQVQSQGEHDAPHVTSSVDEPSLFSPRRQSSAAELSSGVLSPVHSRLDGSPHALHHQHHHHSSPLEPQTASRPVWRCATNYCRLDKAWVEGEPIVVRENAKIELALIAKPPIAPEDADPTGVAREAPSMAVSLSLQYATTGEPLKRREEWSKYRSLFHMEVRGMIGFRSEDMSAPVIRRSTVADDGALERRKNQTFQNVRSDNDTPHHLDAGPLGLAWQGNTCHVVSVQNGCAPQPELPASPAGGLYIPVLVQFRSDLWPTLFTGARGSLRPKVTLHLTLSATVDGCPVTAEWAILVDIVKSMPTQGSDDVDQLGNSSNGGSHVNNHSTTKINNNHQHNNKKRKRRGKKRNGAFTSSSGSSSSTQAEDDDEDEKVQLEATPQLPDEADSATASSAPARASSNTSIGSVMDSESFSALRRLSTSTSPALAPSTPWSSTGLNDEDSSARLF